MDDAAVGHAGLPKRDMIWFSGMQYSIDYGQHQSGHDPDMYKPVRMLQLPRPSSAFGNVNKVSHAPWLMPQITKLLHLESTNSLWYALLLELRELRFPVANMEETSKAPKMIGERRSKWCDEGRV